MAGATIVFCDIVDFSQHGDAEQVELINSLNAEAVCYIGTQRLCPNSSDPDIICLPTGDGMAIVLMIEEAIRARGALFCLLDQLMKWTEKEKAKIRIGVHSGVVNRVPDVTDRPNVCGATINVCQRIMDAAHPNQVLISEQVFIQYIGQKKREYWHEPFSADTPAKFIGPFDIIAKHGQPLHVHIMYREDGQGWSREAPHPNPILPGREDRTRYIADRLKGLNQETGGLTIYEQSAFSTFWINSKSVNQQFPSESKEYGQLLVRQQKHLNALAQKPANRLKIILNPKSRKFNPQSMVACYEGLLAWLKENEHSTNIDWVQATYDGPNRLIVASKFCIEGYKHHLTSGYDLSLVHFNDAEIKDAIESFNNVFNLTKDKENGQTKQCVIESLEAQLEEWRKRQKATAAQALLSDYAAGGELTAFTALDSEDFHA